MRYHDVAIKGEILLEQISNPKVVARDLTRSYISPEAVKQGSDHP
ncbi:MAG: hypothetical protein ACI89J_000490 [Hyphomicrobiaceae bacterium]|jgi:hypothetical protein